MTADISYELPAGEFPRKIYHELMAKKVGEILLVSCPYDAFIMEEEGRLSTRIINEYKGLNLSQPPRLTWASSAKEAFFLLEHRQFDMILAMPGIDGMDIQTFSSQVKKKVPDLPVFLLLHNTRDLDSELAEHDASTIDRTYIWGGDADLLLAIVKNFEDEMNVAQDTRTANVRVIILVEDSPYHYSAFLPVLYKQIVLQTQALIDDSINEDQRILKMRARPKVLVAHDYEQAMVLYEQYQPFILSVFSDVRFPKNGKEDDAAGFKLLKEIKRKSPDLPMLSLSTEEHNREKVKAIPSVFINKTSSNLNDRINGFFKTYLGFGPFVFKMPDGEQIAQVNDLPAMEILLPEIPDESIVYHAQNNDFSRWFMARGEIDFALQLKSYLPEDFPEPQDLKLFLLNSIRNRRRRARQGKIIDFDSHRIDSETDIIKIGNGSLGGKARGLAFMASQLRQSHSLSQAFPDIDIRVPQTVIISTQGFKDFVEINGLAAILESTEKLTDEQILKKFMAAPLPQWLEESLRVYLGKVGYPIAVRSSSLFEDAHYQPFAGLYDTFMLPNVHPNFEKRFDRLVAAVKMVYASTYFAAPRSYARSTMHRTEDEQMAVVLQEITGVKCDQYFYPYISGVAQSYNFYPIAHLEAEDGICHIALGLGKTVMDGGQSLRFCPRYPGFLPQFSVVDDILKNSQKAFYALKLEDFPDEKDFVCAALHDPTLALLDLNDAIDHPAVQQLSSTYDMQDNRIRDVFSKKGFPVLTFANVLKFNAFPLAKLLETIVHMGKKWMGSSVEVEFAVNLATRKDRHHQFSLLQIRPMGRYKQNMKIRIDPDEIQKAFCYSSRSLGNGEYKDIQDLIYVDPETFDPARTLEIASQINQLNAEMGKKGQRYVLIGPGRWGSSDRWLGIPVKWNDISNVGVMVETTIESIKADPSQGSHFFQNITSLGISYMTISDKGDDFIDYQYFKCVKCSSQTSFLKHIRFERPITIRVDGKSSQAVMIPYEAPEKNDVMEDVPQIR